MCPLRATDISGVTSYMSYDRGFSFDVVSKPQSAAYLLTVVSGEFQAPIVRLTNVFWVQLSVLLNFFASLPHASILLSAH